MFIYYLLFLIAIWYIGSCLGSLMLVDNIPRLEKAKSAVSMVPVVAVAFPIILLFRKELTLSTRLKCLNYYVFNGNKYEMLLFAYTEALNVERAKHKVRSNKRNSYKTSENKEQQHFCTIKKTAFNLLSLYQTDRMLSKSTIR